MLTLLDKLFPYSGVREGNAEFEAGLQQIKWLRSKKALAGYCLILTYCLLVVCVGWLLLHDASHTLEGTGTLLAAMSLGAVLTAVATDLVVVRLARAAHSVPSIPQGQGIPGDDFNNQPSSSIQAASDSMANKVKADFALIQLRAWRIMGFEIAFRVTLVALLTVCFFNLLDWPLGQSLNDLGGAFARIYDLSRETISSPGAWAVLLGALILGAQQALEPIWRMRSLAARELIAKNKAMPSMSIGIMFLGWLIALGSYLVPGAFLVVILRNAQLISVGLGLISFALIVCMGTWGLFDWLQQRAFQSLQPVADDLPESGQYIPGQ